MEIELVGEDNYWKSLTWKECRVSGVKRFISVLCFFFKIKKT